MYTCGKEAILQGTYGTNNRSWLSSYVLSSYILFVLYDLFGRLALIRIVVGYKLKGEADIQPVLLKLRSHAITYPGFIDVEYLMNVQDRSIIVELYTWNKLEDWQLWDNTNTRKKILQEADTLLSEPPRVTRYAVLPITRR